LKEYNIQITAENVTSLRKKNLNIILLFNENKMLTISNDRRKANGVEKSFHLIKNLNVDEIEL
jgi:hypothetical protein